MIGSRSKYSNTNDHANVHQVIIIPSSDMKNLRAPEPGNGNGNGKFSEETFRFHWLQEPSGRKSVPAMMQSSYKVVILFVKVMFVCTVPIHIATQFYSYVALRYSHR